MHTRLTPVALAFALLSGAALAQTPKPRVMVIMDTSKSMIEKPEVPIPTCPPGGGGDCVDALPNDAVRLSTPGQRGDYDPALNNACDNKFCAAKSVVYNVIPTFTDQAAIGITTYFQYLVQSVTPDNRSTTCMYDVLAPAGTTRTFTSLFDYTGGGTGDACAAPTPFASCPKTGSKYFPDSTSGSGSNLLRGLCKNPPAYSTPSDPLTTPASCSGLDCYNLVKRTATPNMTLTCPINTWPVTAPRAISSTNWCTAATYPTVSAPVIFPPSGYYEQIVASATASCGTAVMPTTTPPAPVFGTNAKKLNSKPTVGGSVGNWLATNGPNNLNCSTNSYCTMYLGASAPKTYTTDRFWYMFYSDLAFTTPATPVYTPAATYRGTLPTTYNYSTFTNGPNYTGLAGTPLLTGQIAGLPLATSCLAAPGQTLAASNPVGGGSTGSVGRYTSGSLASFNIFSPMTTLTAALPPVPGATNDSPGWGGGTFLCGTGTGTSSTPCDVKVVSDTTVPGTWALMGPIFTVTGLGANQYACNSPGSCTHTTLGPFNANPSFTMLATNPAATSCPSAGSLATTTPPTAVNFNWQTAPFCGAGQMECQWAFTSQGTANAGGSCPNKNFYSASGVPGVCAFNGKPYVPAVPATTPGSMTGSVPATSTCPPSQTLASNTLGLTGTGCGAYPCDITLTGSGPGTPLVSAWGNYDQNSPPPPFTGPPTNSQNVGSPINQSNVGTADVGANDCLGPVGALVEYSNGGGGGSCPSGSTCTVKVLGMSNVGKTCTIERQKDCYSCQYQPLDFQWSQAQTTCSYSTSRRNYTVDQTTLTCTYTHPQWMVEYQNPDTHTCQYGVGARRNDYAAEAYRTCQYWNLQSTFTAPRTTYTYEYQTKGTEILGRASVATPVGSAFCSTPYGGAFQATCPEVSSCSALPGLSRAGTWSLGNIPAGATCKLRYGGGAGGSPAFNLGSDFANNSNGRYQAYIDGSKPLPLGNPAAPSCEEVVAAGDPTGALAMPVSPELYKSNTAPVTGFCYESGNGPQTQNLLFSDWYDPAASNNLANVQTLPMFSGATVTWNNTATKAQGFGASTGLPDPMTGAPPAVRSNFVGIPDDKIPTGVYDPVVQANAIRKVASKCLPPTAFPPNPDGTLQGGACLSNFLDPSSSKPLEGDVTPLFGSLRNTYDYLLDRWNQTDKNQITCRNYYIILATDGEENTPAGFDYDVAPAALPSLVSSFRSSNLSVAPDVKTYVIGFGSGAAGSGKLDLIAAAGGTNTAFSATNQSELAAALRAVFSAITQGTYSRTKPAIGTDGSRLYVAEYVQGVFDAGSGLPSVPDWYGRLTAYRIASGSPQVAWEAGDKIDHQGARTLKAALRKISDSTLTFGDFSSSNIELALQADDCVTCLPTYPGGLTSSQIINFLALPTQPYAINPTATRTHGFGPVHSSSPVVIAKSPFDVSYGGNNPAARSEFTVYGTNTQSRGTRILVQSTDGFMHSIIENSNNPSCVSLGEADYSCPNGTEAWGLFPGMLSGGYLFPFGRPTLSQSIYQFTGAASWDKGLLLNGTLSVADVCERSGDAANCLSTDWKTIAIGTQREGGRGVYAVDVSDGTTPGLSRFLWDFADGDLGFTFSTPAIGRVSHSGKEEFIAIFGGGQDDPGTGTFWSPDFEGNHVFVLNALHGNKIREYSNFWQGGFHWSIDEEVLNRPALWRQPGHAFIDSAYLGVGRKLFAMRFAKSPVTDTGNQWEDPDQWEPDELFDPSSNRNDDPAIVNGNPQTLVRKVVMTAAGSGTTPPTWALQTVGHLPINWMSPPPIYNRPKMAAEVVLSGQVPDLYVGTGNVPNPDAPGSTFSNGNFFYAVHDFNKQPHGSKNDGRALWVVNFPGQEQVVSEPAILSGCIVVATYTPHTGCDNLGDTKLYGFEPLTGELVPCLFEPSTGTDGGASWAGQPVPVVEMKGVGIPSDLLVVNDTVWLKPSGAGLQKAPVRQLPQPGSVRSYRRLK